MGDDEEHYDEDEEDLDEDDEENDEEEIEERSLEEIFDDVDELKLQVDYASSLLDWQDKIKELSKAYNRIVDYPSNVKEEINREYYNDISNLLNRLQTSKEIYRTKKINEAYLTLPDMVSEEIALIDNLKENLENRLDGLDYDANEKCEYCKKERVGYNPIKTREFRRNYREIERIFCSQNCSDNYFYEEG